MAKLKLKLSYDGSMFYGWQVQSQSRNTVQQKLNDALEKIYKEKVRTVGAGRTDSGVHALVQIVAFEPPFNIEPESLLKALNSNLPASIRVHEVESVDDSFAPTHDAHSREYHYYFTNEEIASPFARHFMSNVSYKLDFEQMQKACQLFIGEHDFINFHCVGSDPSSTVREIFSCSIERRESCVDGLIPEHFVIIVKGSGFLKQMVRLMVSTIWAVGRGKRSLGELEDTLNLKTSGHIAPVAPAEGLIKFNVSY